MLGTPQFNQLDRLIITARDNVVSVETERDNVNPISVLVKREEFSTGFRRPKSNRSIVTAGEDSFTVPAECKTGHDTAVAFE